MNAPSSKSSEVKFKVASYNIRKSVGLDRVRDPMRILGIIKELNADIVVLQEVDERLGKRPTTIAREKIAEHTGLVAVDVAANDVSLGWHGNAVLVRKDMEVTAIRRIPLPGLEPRGAVNVDINHTDAEISVIGVHLGLLRSYRRRQLAEIHTQIPKQKLAHSLIIGDFNEWSPSKGLDALEDDFEIVSPGKTFHTAQPVAALDRLALGKSLQLHAAGIVKTGESKIASDHLPIWAEISAKASN
ncbi:MAG: endonuclease/exonuclease/phosphatase family protein [Pseudomonadota bacterium]